MNFRQGQMSGFMLCIAMFSVSAIAQTVTGSGTSNTVPVFTGTSTVGNSPIAISGSNVGIGTTSPAATLDIGNTTGNGALDVALARLGEGTSTGDGTFLGVKAWCTQQTGSCTGQSNILSFSLEHHFYGQTNSSINFYRGGSTSGGFLTFATNNNSERMRIDPSGNVGIGTTSPSEPLEVNGNAKVNGTLTVAGTGGVNVQNAGITFPDGSLQTTAYPASSSGGSAAIEVQNNEVVINGGMSANGSGLKHVSTNASCTTPYMGKSGGATSCGLVVMWPGTPFADTNYTVTCTPKAVIASNGNNYPDFHIFIPDANKTTTSTTILFMANNSEQSDTLSGINCIAIHD